MFSKNIKTCLFPFFAFSRKKYTRVTLVLLLVLRFTTYNQGDYQGTLVTFTRAVGPVAGVGTGVPRQAPPRRRREEGAAAVASPALRGRCQLAIVKGG